MLTGTLLITAATLMIGATAGRPSVQLFQSAKGDERVRTLKVPTGPPFDHQLVDRVELRGVRPGDVAQVTAQLEVTNGLGFNVMVAHFLTRNGTAPIAPAYPAGENVSPNMHHTFRTVGGAFVVPNDVQDNTTTVELWAYAASDVARAGDTVAVNRGYGGVTVIVHSNSE